MITFEEAKKIAFSVAGWKKLDCCSEYQEAWYFYNSTEDWTGEPGVVIMKDDGRKRTFIQFLTECSPEKEPKRLNLDGAEITAADGDVQPLSRETSTDDVIIMDEGWRKQIRRTLEQDLSE